MEQLNMYGETMQTVHEVTYLADLNFAQGGVGDVNPLPTTDEKETFALDMGQEVHEITKPTTAYCGDEREIARMHDGSSTEEHAFRLFGGIGLATTKALVAANASVIAEASNISEAYSKVSELLDGLDYEDAGHADCGARKKVKESVEAVYDEAGVGAGMSLFGVTDPAVAERLSNNKKSLLARGFYDNWSPEDHESYLQKHYPQNYAYLKGAHEGSGLVAVTTEGLTLSSNGRAFAVTTELMQKLAGQLSSGSHVEEQMIYAAFVDDALRVGGLIVKKGFPAFQA